MSYPQASEQENLAVSEFKQKVLDQDAFEGVLHPSLDIILAKHSLVAPRIYYLYSIGDYEQSDLTLMQHFIHPEDVVLELGAGVGITSALSSKITKKPVFVVDADSRLKSLMHAQEQANSCSINFIHGCIQHDTSQKYVSFFIHNEVWFSSLSPTSDSSCVPVQVPVINFIELLEAKKPTVCIIDIEGAEVGLFNSKFLHLPKKIIIEIHFPKLGEASGCQIINEIIALGYQLTTFSGWTFVFIQKELTP